VISTADAIATDIRHQGYDSFPRPRGNFRQGALSNEEVFLALAGSAVAELDGEPHTFAAGDCLVVPTNTPFTLAAGGDGLVPVCAMAAGGRATILPDGPTITPRWED
jgi:hypothetical protein